MDKVTKEQRSRNMAAIKSKGMKPEITVRSIAHNLGYRFRLHRKDLPGKPDLVFPGRQKVIFVHGCFWHQHNSRHCKSAHAPRSNTDYWEKKLRGNVERDKRNIAQIHAMGWDVLVIWECQTKDSLLVENLLQTFLNRS